MKDIEINLRLRFVIFFGDIGYVFIGEKYISMLKYIEPLTSRMAFMTTPGNHDTLNEDAY